MRHPEWIKVRSSGTHETRKVLRDHGVSTVCEEARCPNQGKCFTRGTAAFLILGDRCTRNCSFCAVDSLLPLPVDPEEPFRVAQAVSAFGLRYVVITSVTRDDLPDGGAAHFAMVIQKVRDAKKDIKIEVLTPDFKGNAEALRAVMSASPDVFNHNVETVPRLYPSVRPQADYSVSLHILRTAKRQYPEIMTKSGMMLGVGETEGEVLSVMRDLRDTGCDILTIGQYLRPRKNNIPVAEYIQPEVFDRYRSAGYEMGFRSVASSPLTRSSMDAEEMYYNNPAKMSHE